MAVTASPSRSLSALRDRLEAELPALMARAMVPGVVVGVDHAGERMVFAHGTAHMGTGAPMTARTAWPLGSVTKVLTTTLVLRLVERGLIDLDERVVSYLPDFALAEPGTAAAITVRHLLNHTNGIDADTLMSADYLGGLRRCGTLFTPGELVSYSNPGFVLAGHVAEAVTGRGFDELLADEVYAPVGMAPGSGHDIAWGSLPDAASGQAVIASRQLGPQSGAAAGATPIVTADGLLDFAVTHLHDGESPNGTRVLGKELVTAMREVTFDLGTPNAPPVGLGWWLPPVAGTTAWWHGGSTPGGSSSLTVLPEHELAVVSYGNGALASALHDAVLALALPAGFVELDPPAVPESTHLRVEGVYEHFQARMTVEGDDEGIRGLLEMVFVDDEHRDLMEAFTGGQSALPPMRFEQLGHSLFKPAGAPSELFAGPSGRISLLSFHQPDETGRPRFAHTRLRAARGVTEAAT